MKQLHVLGNPLAIVRGLAEGVRALFDSAVGGAAGASVAVSG